MQENAKQNLEKENLLNEKLDSAIPKPDVIDQSSNDNKELEMAKKAKQDADKPPSNLGGNQANEKATGNLSDSYNDLGQEDSPPLGFFEKYVKPASKKFTDFTAGLIKDSRSLVDWFLGPSKGKPMNDPVSKFFSKLADWLGLNKTIKLIKDAIDDKRLKSNIVPDGHKGSNLQEDKQPAQDSRKFDPRLDFDSVAQEMGVGNNKDRQFNNANNELKESNGKNQLIADNKSSSSAQDPYQVDNESHEMQSDNPASPLKAMRLSSINLHKTMNRVRPRLSSRPNVDDNFGAKKLYVKAAEGKGGFDVDPPKVYLEIDDGKLIVNNLDNDDITSHKSYVNNEKNRGVATKQQPKFNR